MNLKKISAFLLAAIMALSLSCAAYASGGGEDDAGEVIYERKTDMSEITGSVTPNGNLTLIDDLKSDGEDVSNGYSESLRLMTVETKSGHYFYIVMDMTKDENNVYFLNLVDEADLMAIMEGTEVAYEPICVCRFRCEDGSINEDCPVCRDDGTMCKGKDPEPLTETEDTEPVKENKKTNVLPFVVIGIVIVLGAGAFWYVKYGREWLSIRGDDDAEEVADRYESGDEDYDE